MVNSQNRLEKYFASGNLGSPTLSKDLLKSKAAEAELEEEPKLSDGDNGFDDGDDGDDDDDDDWEDDDDEYLEDKLRLAEDEDSIITGARIIFQRDHTTNKVYMIARLDEIDLPEDFSGNGEEMFKGDIIFQLQGKAYLGPHAKLQKINSKVFKKKNWDSRSI